MGRTIYRGTYFEGTEGGVSVEKKAGGGEDAEGGERGDAAVRTKLRGGKERGGRREKEYAF